MPGNEEIETPSLLERLRARREWSPSAIESKTEYVTVATYGPPLVNPDGPEAAVVIERMTEALIAARRELGNAVEIGGAPMDSLLDTGRIYAMIDRALEDHSNGSAACQHEGYSLAKHGRCCPNCGELLTDFGD